ncbi:MAG: GspE/PulE family protein [Spirochaetia bacterium]
MAGIPLEQDQSVRLTDFAPLPQDQYPLEFMQNHRICKLEETEEAVAVGICSPENTALAENLRIHHKKPIRFYRIEWSELSSYMNRKLSDQGPSQTGGDSGRMIALDDIEGDAPAINLVNSILIEGIRREASDIHIESFGENVWVRYRIDGVLVRASEFSLDRFQAVSSRIKVMANMNIMERRMPQDGRISVQLENANIDLRVSVVPIAGGESIVLRIFRKEEESFKLEDLGFDTDVLSTFRALCKNTDGLFLVTGPTGSGKTTTLHAALMEIVDEKRKFITIEDPIENRIRGVDQIQTNEAIGLSFEVLLRRILRQDPDVIMVGEIRDTETAALAVRASLTGHLVFATLHTNDSVSVIPRLLNMGVEGYLLADVLRGAAAQRLVRRVCSHCKTSYTPTAAELNILTLAGQEPEVLYRGSGCVRCANTGYKGRAAVTEVFSMDRELSEMVAESAPMKQINEYLYSAGMVKLRKYGLKLAAMGVTTIEEIERTMGT